jgi:DNA-binding response OmpR family regulator
MFDFSGLQALVVEDESGVALLIEDMLAELGFMIRASVARLGEARKVASTAAVDLALLDVNLQGELVFPVARVLLDRNIPIVFSTGYGDGVIPPEFNKYPVLNKPFAIEELRKAIAKALTRA